MTDTNRPNRRVLLAGDDDFAHELRALHETGARVMVFPRDRGALVRVSEGRDLRRAEHQRPDGGCRWSFAMQATDMLANVLDPDATWQAFVRGVISELGEQSLTVATEDGPQSMPLADVAAVMRALTADEVQTFVHERQRAHAEEAARLTTFRDRIAHAFDRR